MADYNFIATDATDSWNTGANWDLGTVPTSTDNVTFNAGTQTVTGTGSAANAVDADGSLVFAGTFDFATLALTPT